MTEKFQDGFRVCPVPLKRITWGCGGNLARAGDDWGEPTGQTQFGFVEFDPTFPAWKNVYLNDTPPFFMWFIFGKVRRGVL